MDACEIFGSEKSGCVGALAHIGTPEIGIPAIIKGGVGFTMTMRHAGTDPDTWDLDQVDKFRKAGISNFGMNLLYAENPRIAKDVELIMRIKPRYVTVSAVPLRPPRDIFKELREAGIILGMLIGNGRYLGVLEKTLDTATRPDFVVLEGNGSGGHNGSEDTATLMLSIRAFKAAGYIVGIAGEINSREAANWAFKAGADFVQFGSRPAVCVESIAHPNYKDAVVAGVETIQTGERFMHAVRVLPTDFALELKRLENQPETTWESLSKVATGSIPQGLLNGSYTRGVFTIGKDVRFISRIQPIADICHDILHDKKRG